MLHSKISSLSSNSTVAFDTSSIIRFSENNFNRNANDTDEDLNKEALIQSSTDITNDLYSSINLSKNNGAMRIESALMTSDYSHTSRPTIDLVQRNGAGDENPSSYKQPQTPTNQYLTLEQVPVYNRRTIQFTTKQLILISISVFVFVILMCLTTVYFYFIKINLS